MFDAFPRQNTRLLLPWMQKTLKGLPMQENHVEELNHECTSRMLFHDLTGNSNILHKKRDSHARAQTKESFKN
jgi:hypothetical protein